MNTENYLNNLFDIARNAEPVSSIDEMENAILQQQPLVPKRNPILKPKILIIMSASLFLLAGFYLLLPQKTITHQQEPKTSEVRTQKEIQPKKPSGPAFTKVAPPVKSSNKPIPPMKETVRKPDVENVHANQDLEMHGSNPTTGKEEPKHVIVPYKPDYFPSGKISADRCLSINNNSINLMNIHLIELTDEELLKLGIEVKDKAIVVATNTRENGKPLKTTYTKAGSNFDMMLKFVRKTDSTTKVSESRFVINKERARDIDTTLRPISICENKEVKISINAGPDQAIAFPKLTTGETYPEYALITDDLGQLWRSYKMEFTLSNNADPNDPTSKKLNKEEMMERAEQMRKQAQKELRLKIAGFIPILVRSGDENLPEDKAKNYWRADIIVWFEPTEKLFNALPARISDDLRKEYQSVFVKNGASSCKYFETCKNIPGAIESFQVYPNPTEDLMSVEMNLKESRVLTASIYTINGQEVKSVFRNQSFDKGMSTQEIHINDLPEGIYLLVVVSTNGDMISKRVIRK